MPIVSPDTKYAILINKAITCNYSVPDGNMPDMPSHAQDSWGSRLEWLKNLWIHLLMEETPFLVAPQYKCANQLPSKWKETDSSLTKYIPTTVSTPPLSSISPLPQIHSHSFSALPGHQPMTWPVPHTSLPWWSETMSQSKQVFPLCGPPGVCHSQEWPDMLLRILSHAISAVQKLYQGWCSLKCSPGPSSFQLLATPHCLLLQRLDAQECSWEAGIFLLASASEMEDQTMLRNTEAPLLSSPYLSHKNGGFHTKRSKLRALEATVRTCLTKCQLPKGSVTEKVTCHCP